MDNYVQAALFDELEKIAEVGAGIPTIMKLASREKLLGALRGARAAYTRAGGAGGRAMGKKATRAQHAEWVRAGNNFSAAHPGDVVSRTFAGDKMKAKDTYNLWNRRHKINSAKPSAMERLKGAVGLG
jgi:hypothetical protein